MTQRCLGCKHDKDQHTMRSGPAAFAAAAVALGWRRIGGKGYTIADLPLDGSTQYIVPDAKTWISCPEHCKGCVCAWCGFDPCSCMGGPRFDVRPE